MKLYHVTRSKYVPEILRKGLTAGKRRGSTELLYRHFDRRRPEFAKAEKGTLYFLDDLESAGEFVSMLRGIVRRPTKFSILEIDLPRGSRVEPDERQFGGGTGSLGGFLRSDVTRVPPSSIKLVGSVVLRPAREPVYSLGAVPREQLELGQRSSELAAKLEEPESQEEIRLTKEEISKLPETSRAHRVVEERESRLEVYGKAFIKYEKEK